MSKLRRSLLLAAFAAVTISLSFEAQARFPRGDFVAPFASDLVVHFDAASPALSNGANLTSWTDTVNGIAAGTVVGTAPTYATNRLNGKPSVQFGGAGGLEIATPGALKTAIDSQDYTVFIVFRTLGSASLGGLFSAANGGSPTFWYYADGTNVGSLSIGQAVVPFAGQTSFSTLGSTSFASLPYSSSGKFQSFYLNGGAYTSTAGASPVSGSNAFRIGTTVNNFPGNVEIFDILIYRRALTPPEYMQLEMWACNKYGQAYPWAGVSAFNTFFGDSILEGVGASDVAHQAPYLAAQSLGLSFGQWHNIAVSGINTNDMNLLAPTWVDPIPALIGKTHNVSGFEYYNQSFATGDATIMKTKAQTYLAARKLIANQKTVWGTSTSFSGDPSALRAAYDTAFDGSHATDIDSYVAIHNDTHIGVSGSYATFSSGGDGVHLVDATYPYLAALFVAGINALP